MSCKTVTSNFFLMKRSSALQRDKQFEFQVKSVKKQRGNSSPVKRAKGHIRLIYFVRSTDNSPNYNSTEISSHCISSFPPHAKTKARGVFE